MATYYAINSGGNWNAGGTWSTTSAKDASRTGGSTAPTTSDDCILDDYSGSVTVTAAGGNAKTVNCMVNGNYSGTLTFTGQLNVAGNVTLSSTMTVAGSNQLAFTASATYTPNTKTIPNLYVAGSFAIAMGGNVSVSGDVTTIGSNASFTGAYNITSAGIRIPGQSTSGFTFPAGQTWTVTTRLSLHGSNTSASFLKSSSTGNPFYLVYQGTAANCAISEFTFTDVDASGPSFPLVDWCAGAMTRVVNIVSASEATYPSATRVANGVDRGDGVTGTGKASTASTLFGSGEDLASANLLTGHTVGDVTGAASAQTIFIDTEM